MNARRRDTVSLGAARAWEDAEPDLAAAAERHGMTARNGRYWREHGPPEAKAFARFVLVSNAPWRHAAFALATAKLATVEHLTRAEVIERLREIRALEKAVEGEDNAADCTAHMDARERATLAQRDVALNAEKGALWLRIAELGIDPCEVLGC